MMIWSAAMKFSCRGLRALASMMRRQPSITALSGANLRCTGVNWDLRKDAAVQHRTTGSNSMCLSRNERGLL